MLLNDYDQNVDSFLCQYWNLPWFTGVFYISKWLAAPNPRPPGTYQSRDACKATSHPGLWLHLSWKMYPDPNVDPLREIPIEGTLYIGGYLWVINGYNPQWQNSAEMTALEILSGSYIFWLLAGWMRVKGSCWKRTMAFVRLAEWFIVRCSTPFISMTLKNQDLKPTGPHWTTPCFSLNCCCCWSRPWHVLQILWYIEHGKHGGHGGKHGAQGKVQGRSGSTGGTMKKSGNKNHRLLLALNISWRIPLVFVRVFVNYSVVVP